MKQICKTFRCVAVCATILYLGITCIQSSEHVALELIVKTLATQQVTPMPKIEGPKLEVIPPLILPPIPQLQPQSNTLKLPDIVQL